MTYKAARINSINVCLPVTLMLENYMGLFKSLYELQTMEDLQWRIYSYKKYSISDV